MTAETPTGAVDRGDHAYWASVCTCGMSEQERTGHYPEHASWCDVPSPLDDDEPAYDYEGEDNGLPPLDLARRHLTDAISEWGDGEVMEGFHTRDLGALLVALDSLIPPAEVPAGGTQ